MSIRDLYLKKVAMVYSDDTIEDAIEVMRDYGVDDVVVVEKRSSGMTMPVGMLTGHDIVMRAYRLKFGQQDLLVKQVMTHNLVTCHENFGVYETIELMQRNSVKRIPVVGESGELLGIITASDLLTLLGDELGRLSQRPSTSIWGSDHLNARNLNS